VLNAFASTWMAIEAEAGHHRARAEPGFWLYCWNPEGLGPREVGRQFLVLAAELLRGAAEAAQRLLGDLEGSAAPDRAQ
jgi:hypothetical protein